MHLSWVRRSHASSTLPFREGTITANEIELLQASLGLRCELLEPDGEGIVTVATAVVAMGRPGVESVEPLKVVSRGKDWMTAWDQIWKW